MEAGGHGGGSVQVVERTLVAYNCHIVPHLSENYYNVIILELTAVGKLLYLVHKSMVPSL